MQHYSSQAFTDIGKPAGGATITVRVAGTNNNATIYSDDGITVKSNPFVANTLGQFDFYVASGKYDITVTGTQLTTYTLPNQVVFDPFEQTAADLQAKVQSLQVTGAATLPTITGPTAVSGGGLTVAAGQVLSADQVTPLNSAGFGGFWGVFIYSPASGFGTSFGFVQNANEVRVVQFVLPYRVQIGKVSCRVAVGVGASIADLGIYSSAGALLANTGGFSTASSNTSLSINLLNAPITLPAGVYYFAQTATVSTLGGLTAFASSTNGGDATIIVAGGSKTWGLAANAATAGVLPATLGVITNTGTGASEIVAAYFER